MPPLPPPDLYHWITRFGEIGILWPVALAVGLWMLLIGRSWRLVAAWLVPLGVATAVTTASKLAFIGWGVGIRSIDFTGFSGHAMFSAAIYPVLAFALTASGRPERRPWQVLAVALAYAFATLIAYSRVVIDAHSWSEVVAGSLLGAAASGATLFYWGHPPAKAVLRWALMAVLCWFVLMPGRAAPSRTHDVVITLALKLSGHERPFSRADLHARAPAAWRTQ